MIQAQNIRLPGPVYTQLKALAAARSTTMVEVVASFLLKAVEAGEIAPESSGVSTSLHLDLDVEENQGPYVVVHTPAGDMPPMTREDALTVAAFLVSDDRGADSIRHVRTSRGNRWSVERRGTSAVLVGQVRNSAKSVTFTMAPVVARGLSEQMVRIAPSAVHDIED